MILSEQKIVKASIGNLKVKKAELENRMRTLAYDCSQNDRIINEKQQECVSPFLRVRVENQSLMACFFFNPPD
jgi:hypothetical protein